MKTAYLLPLTLLMSAPAASSFAQSAPKLNGTHGDWKVYTRGTGSETICYALSKATTSSPANVDHGDIYFMVSNWKNGAATEQPSFLAGYGLKTTRAPKARVGSTLLNMYAAERDAFIDTRADERKLVAKMRAGSTMTVQATSQRGTNTSYQFSLKGVTAALRSAKAACA